MPGRIAIVVLAVGLFAAGCLRPGDMKKAGGNSDEKGNTKTKKSDEKPGPITLETIPADKIGEVEGGLPPLDEGRIEISKPAGWHLATRSPKYLAGFSENEGGGGFPVIVFALPADDPDFENVDADNAVAYATAVRDELAQQGKPYAAEVGAVKVGNFFGARYTRDAESDKRKLRILTLVTTSGHRRYRFELQSLAGSFPFYEKAVWAVADTLKFHAAGE